MKEEPKPGGILGTRYKSRSVARVFAQVEGRENSETFVPVLKFTSIRILMSIVTIIYLLLCQIDVGTAFLNGYLEEAEYMRQQDVFGRLNPVDIFVGCCDHYLDRRKLLVNVMLKFINLL